jgi:hypothetical protein
LHAANPSSRRGAVYGIDPAKKIWLFGGQSANSYVYTDVWSYTLPNTTSSSTTGLSPSNISVTTGGSTTGDSCALSDCYCVHLSLQSSSCSAGVMTVNGHVELNSSSLVLSSGLVVQIRGNLKLRDGSLLQLSSDTKLEVQQNFEITSLDTVTFTLNSRSKFTVIVEQH